MIKSIISLFFLTLSAPVLCQGTAEFLAKATPGFLEIEGKGAEVIGKAVVGKDTMISGTFKVDLRKLSTGIDLRDEHMRDNYLDVKQFPEAVFVLDPVLFAAGTHKKFSGTLTLHGVKKKISGIVDFEPTKANAQFEIDLTAFGIKVPTYKILTVGKEVEIKVGIPI